ncbi:phage tail tape measure protein [Arthrobacter sp. U41]|uniref:phage tail tape measure protein n=1 Tax=Arthrobacter sp. U41 TaxID=1849032 RepID=UPI0008593A7D|nr:phage tail tape measure protein [Arthrobacter sp. U41]AOT04944.1 phage tail tape measure protein [Arthrobacter sp. U41]
MSNDHVIDVKARADFTALSKGLADAERDLGKAKEGFSKYGSEADKATKQTQGFVEKNRGHMETVGRDSAIMGGAILAGIAVAVHAYSEFSGRMAQVQSLSGATAAEMDVLTNSALTMGTAFGLSANDVADAEIELVKAGVSVKEMIGGALPGALALAAAGQIDVGKATEIATIALTQFNLKGKDVPHVADLLAAGADKALGGVSELGEGLKQGGLIASQFGLSIDDTVGTLSAFANAGLLGSDAGTSMKTMFLALASPSKAAQAALDQYNITAYDSKGAFIGVEALAGQLKDKLGGLSDAQRNAALSTIFGTDAMRSASVLVKEGSAGIRKWIDDVNDQGFAAQQAAGKMDSLNGDFKKLKASVETGLIQMGAAADGALRPVVQALTGAITAFNGLDDSTKSTILTVAGLAGSTLLLGGILLSTIPKIAETAKAIQALRAASPAASATITALGKAALPAAAALTALLIMDRIGDSMKPATKSVEEAVQSFVKLGKEGKSAGDIFGKDFFGSSNGAALSGEIRGVGDALKEVNNLDLGDNLNDMVFGITSAFGMPVSSQINETRASLGKMDDALQSLSTSGSFDLAAKGFKQITEEGLKQGIAVETTAKSFPQYMDSLRKLSNDLKVPLNDQELLNWALGEVPQKMKDAQTSTEGQAKAAEVAAKATEAQQKALDELGIAADGAILHLDKLVQSMQASGLISISADQAAINYQKSLEEVDAMVFKNGQTLDIHTKAGKENMESWLGQASAANNATLANAKNGMSSEELQVNLTDQYYKLRDNALAFGAGATEADNMARKALGIPKDVKIETAIQNYADTMAKAHAIKQAVDGITSVKTIFFQTDASGFYDPSAGTDGKGAGSGGMSKGPRAYAKGGAIDDAPGPKGVDSQLIYAAKGEHMLDTSDVDALGGQSGVYAMRRALHNGGVRPTYAAAPPAAPVAMGGFGGGGGSPEVRVYIGNEQIDARIEYVSEGVTTRALNGVSRQVGGMRR